MKTIGEADTTYEEGTASRAYPIILTLFNRWDGRGRKTREECNPKLYSYKNWLKQKNLKYNLPKNKRKWAFPFFLFPQLWKVSVFVDFDLPPWTFPLFTHSHWYQYYPYPFFLKKILILSYWYAINNFFFGWKE